MNRASDSRNQGRDAAANFEAARNCLRPRIRSSTTGDIADAAGIATGTLFNYFPTKEALLASLAAEAVAGVDGDFEESAGECLKRSCLRSFRWNTQAQAIAEALACAP